MGTGDMDGMNPRLASRRRRGAALAAAFDELRQANGGRGALEEIALNGFQIAAQQVRAGRLADGAGLQVEQERELPFGEGVAPYGAADDFLDELAERRQVSTSRSRICQAREWSFPQKILSAFCDSGR